MGGFATTSQGEGASMIDGCNEKVFARTEVSKCMLCVCHDGNTVNKDRFNSENMEIKEVNIDALPQVNVLKKMFEI